MHKICIFCSFPDAFPPATGGRRRDSPLHAQPGGGCSAHPAKTPTSPLRSGHRGGEPGGGGCCCPAGRVRTSCPEEHPSVGVDAHCTPAHTPGFPAAFPSGFPRDPLRRKGFPTLTRPAYCRCCSAPPPPLVSGLLHREPPERETPRVLGSPPSLHHSRQSPPLLAALTRRTSRYMAMHRRRSWYTVMPCMAHSRRKFSHSATVSRVDAVLTWVASQRA